MLVEPEDDDQEGHRNLFHQGCLGVGRRAQRDGSCQLGTFTGCSVCRSKMYMVITFSKVSPSGDSGGDYWREGFPPPPDHFFQGFLKPLAASSLWMPLKVNSRRQE